MGSLSAEADCVVECALNYGRRVEAFVATKGEHAGVNTRIEDAWEDARRQGKFSVSRSLQPVFCCVGVLSKLMLSFFIAAYDFQNPLKKRLGLYLEVSPSHIYRVSQG